MTYYNLILKLYTYNFLMGPAKGNVSQPTLNTFENSKFQKSFVQVREEILSSVEGFVKLFSIQIYPKIGI